MWLLVRDKTLGEMEAVKVIAVKWTSTSSAAAAPQIISGRPIGRRNFLYLHSFRPLYIWSNATFLPTQEAFGGGLTAPVGVSDAQMRNIEAPEAI